MNPTDPSKSAQNSPRTLFSPSHDQPITGQKVEKVLRSSLSEPAGIAESKRNAMHSAPESTPSSPKFLSSPKQSLSGSPKTTQVARHWFGEPPVDSQIKTRIKIDEGRAPWSSPWNRDESDEKVDITIEPQYDSDQDPCEWNSEAPIHIFSRNSKAPAAATTIRCSDGKMKGGELVRTVHQEVRKFYDNLVEMGFDLQPPALDLEWHDGGLDIVAIWKPEDWVLTLGGFKGMAPQNTEVTDYFVYLRQQIKDRKFGGVRVGDDFSEECRDDYEHPREDSYFKIEDHRLFLFEYFEIAGEKIAKDKTDLSYKQIVDAIAIIKKKSGMTDSEIATLQICLLDPGNRNNDGSQKIPEGNRWQVERFLNFLNVLMFGIEPSGLNAGLATGLMLLELIQQKKITYQTALLANESGGVYPFACLGNNQGTYKNRGTILGKDLQFHKQKPTKYYSMKRFRNAPSYSPVGTKEAILIRYWLLVTEAVSPEMTYKQLQAAIKKAVNALLEKYFLSPKGRDPYN